MFDDILNDIDISRFIKTFGGDLLSYYECGHERILIGDYTLVYNYNNNGTEGISITYGLL